MELNKLLCPKTCFAWLCEGKCKHIVHQNNVNLENCKKNPNLPPITQEEWKAMCEEIQSITGGGETPP